MWHPDIAALNDHVSAFENGLYCSLMRLQNFTAENADVEILPGVRIVHSDHMTNPISIALKGEACWSETRRREYHAEHGANQSETVSAYHGAKESKREPFVYDCDWESSDYYLESISDMTGSQGKHPLQAEVEQKNRAAMIAMIILAPNTISSIKPVSLIAWPRQKINASTSHDYFLDRHINAPSPVFHLKQADEPALKSIARGLFERQHPEAYLASLRLFRALKRRQLDDSIVDLVIALEALFNGNHEMAIAHKISQRLTRLLNQPKTQRRETTKVIKQAYGLRSSLVHGTKRQIESIEAALEKSPRDRKKLVDNTEIRTLRDQLIDLVSAALVSRYTTHRDTAIENLILWLDDQAI